MITNTLIMRCEESSHEQRAPLTPEDARRLSDTGCRLLIESSPQRIFPDQAYQEQGCEITASGSWRQAGPEATILGIKALPENAPLLRQKHIFFAHAYRGQPHSTPLLQRFKTGGGTILDLEYLVDLQGVRLISFSRYAGIAGAIVGLNALLPNPYSLTERISSAEWIDRLHDALPVLKSYRYLVTGAEGRCGGGVCFILERLSIPFERWTLQDTISGRPFSEIENYPVIFHCAAAMSVQPPMVTLANQGLSLIVDITCDIGNPFNLLDLGHHATTFDAPVQTIARQPTPLKVVAIDHLPNLLPEESSRWFSSQLLPLLLDPSHLAWQKSLNHFHTIMRGIT